MNDLQKLLKLRGISVCQMAADLELEYTQVQQTVKRATYRNRHGKVYERKNPQVRRAVAEYLGLTYSETWEDPAALRAIIAREISQKQRDFGESLKVQFLQGNATVPELRKAGNA